MFKKLMTFSLLCLTLSAGLNAWAGFRSPGVNYRQNRQEHRIDNGVRSGELNRREAFQLNKGQQRINRMEDRFRADGHLSARERARLHHAQNKQSRAIYRQKHDNQNRY